MIDIDEYKNSKVLFISKNSFSNNWIIVLLTIFVVIIIFSFIPFNIYKNYKGLVTLEGKQSYINLMLESSDFPINKFNKLYINGILYEYSIEEISENIVKIKTNLKENIKLQNNILLVSVLKDRTTLIKIVEEKIKKGFGI